MLTPQAIEEKVFSNARLAAGYAKAEVDEFLHAVALELDVAQKTAAGAQAQLAQAAAQPSAPVSPTVTITPVQPAPVEHSITKILQRGQQLADEALADVKVEVERLKAEAQVEADKIKADALAKAEQIKVEAVAELTKLQADSAKLASTNATAAKILQNALAALNTPPA